VLTGNVQQYTTSPITHVTRQVAPCGRERSLRFRCCRVDQVADVGVAGGDDAVERSIDLLEGLQPLELLYIRLIGFDDGSIGIVGADLLQSPYRAWRC
jgi:hypothetical protein